MDEILLTFMSGPKDGDIVSVQTLLDSGKPSEITIGRREGCDVCLNYDSQVSREHALVIYDGEFFWLEDTNSTNGTFIGEEKINNREKIKPGQLFRVGRTWLRVEPVAHYSPIDDDSLPF